MGGNPPICIFLKNSILILNLMFSTTYLESRLFEKYGMNNGTYIYEVYNKSEHLKLF